MEFVGGQIFRHPEDFPFMSARVGPMVPSVTTTLFFFTFKVFAFLTNAWKLLLLLCDGGAHCCKRRAPQNTRNIIKNPRKHSGFGQTQTDNASHVRGYFDIIFFFKNCILQLFLLSQLCDVRCSLSGSLHCSLFAWVRASVWWGCWCLERGGGGFLLTACWLAGCCHWKHFKPPGKHTHRDWPTHSDVGTQIDKCKHWYTVCRCRVETW